MPAASILIKPASANCNINCNYCFYKCLSRNRQEYSKGFMSDETIEKLIRNAFSYADGFVSFAFQGGEPTLAGLDFFRQVVRLQKEWNTNGLIVENTIQTNGLLIDEEWASFLAENHFLIGLSLDGPKKLHDTYRVDVNGEPTFERTMQTVNLLKQYRADYNIVTVVTNQTAQKAGTLYNFYKRNKFPFVQMIPCMGEQGSGYAVTPGNYGKFLCEFFDLWYTDFMAGLDMDVRMFSNLAQMAAGYPAEECGMNGHCTCYFVVEGDGSVYPCDFYCMDQWKLGTVDEAFGQLASSEKAGEFLAPSRNTYEKCKACPHVALCRGGCRRWRQVDLDGGLGLNVLCQAYEIFFAHTKDRIRELGQLILRQYGPCQK